MKIRSSTLIGLATVWLSSATQAPPARTIRRASSGDYSRAALAARHDLAGNSGRPAQSGRDGNPRPTRARRLRRLTEIPHEAPNIALPARGNLRYVLIAYFSAATTLSSPRARTPFFDPPHLGTAAPQALPGHLPARCPGSRKLCHAAAVFPKIAMYFAIHRLMSPDASAR